MNLTWQKSESLIQPLAVDKNLSKIMFDDKYIVSGSYNWTTNATKYNSENCNFFEQPHKEYSQRFEYLWRKYNNY